ncbi:hypothetical protein MRB53_038256 [Persea americana]|nr:hypothetical protein MRB53_038256 [Persea americana]
MAYERDKTTSLVYRTTSTAAPLHFEQSCTDRPAIMNDLTTLLSRITSQTKLYLTASSEDARKALVRTVRRLYLFLETPIETTLRLNWADRASACCIQAGVKLHLFEKLSQTVPKSSRQLADEVRADAVLLSRILKHLVAMDYLNEVEADQYTSTKFTEALADPKISSAWPFMNDAVEPAVIGWPEYLEMSGFRNPSNPLDGPFQHGHQTKVHFFDMLAAKPGLAKDFNNHMLGYGTGRKIWYEPECYPVQERLISGMDADSPLLVDIGGGVGRDITEFRARFPLGGTCILQELPEVAKEAKVGDGVEAGEGARAYYMHSVLHDWPDAKVIEILSNITRAMKRGYSKILINENVIPAEDAYWMTTGLDIMMLMLFASTERTEETWRALLEQAGLKITHVCHYETGSESLIEAELA